MRRAPGIHIPVLSCFVAALLFGSSTPFSKALLSSIGPLTLAGLLYLGAAVAVLPLSLRGSSAVLRRDRRQRLLLGLAVLFGGGIGPVLLLLGLRAAPAASVSLWLNMETAATAILAWIFREHLDGRTWPLLLWCPGAFPQRRRALQMARRARSPRVRVLGLDNNDGARERVRAGPDDRIGLGSHCGQSRPGSRFEQRSPRVPADRGASPRRRAGLRSSLHFGRATAGRQFTAISRPPFIGGACMNFFQERFVHAGGLGALMLIGLYSC